jgi:hypothetical protein
MNTSLMSLASSSLSGPWPIDVVQYDRSPDLYENERAELAWLMGVLATWHIRSNNRE